MANLSRQAIIDALRAFAEQRPGLEPANYGGDWRGYRSESRSITRDLHDARTRFTPSVALFAARAGGSNTPTALRLMNWPRFLLSNSKD